MSEKAELRRSVISLVIFGLLIAAYALVFTAVKTEIKHDVALNIYENGVIVGETVVHIDGTRADFLLSRFINQNDNFGGRFAIELAERTCSEHTTARISWWEHEGGLKYQDISFWSYSTTLGNDTTGVSHMILINPSMTEMAIQLTDGRVLASSETVYEIYTEHFTYNAANGTTGFSSGIPEF